MESIFTRSTLYINASEASNLPFYYFIGLICVFSLIHGVLPEQWQMVTTGFEADPLLRH